MIILRISRIVTFDTSYILALLSQLISRLDASLNIHPVSSIPQVIGNTLRHKWAAEHLVPHYQNKIYDADNAFLPEIYY